MKQSDSHIVASMFSAIAAGADDAFIVINEDQKIVVFNDAAESLFGYSYDEVARKPLSVLLPESAAAGHHDLVKSFNVNESTWRSMSRRPSVQALKADGSEFQAAITILKTTTSGSTLFGAIVRDVTGHERADALLQGTLTATAGVTGQEFFDTAVKVLSETLAVHTAFIATPVPNVVGMSRMIANWSGGANRALRDFALEQTPCSLAMEQAVVHIPTGVHEHFPSLYLARGKPAEGFLSLKLDAATGQFLGHITLLHSAELNLTQRELSSLRVVGSRIAAEIDRVRINSEIVLESEFQNRIALSAPFGIAQRNTLTNETWCNESFREIMGRSYAECRAIGWENVVHPDDYEEFVATSAEMRTSGITGESVTRFIHPNGETRWVKRHGGSRLDSEGRPVLLSTTIVDLTATYRALEQLELKSEELDARNTELQGSLNAFSDIRVRVGADGTFRSVEASEDADLFAPTDAVMGSSLTDFLSPSAAQAAMAALKQALDTSEVTSVQYSWESPTGMRDYEARFAPVAEDEVLAVVRDISDLRALEAQVVHASTMKSVGLLAGGLAHDFNNVLHVIGGHASALGGTDGVVTTGPESTAIERRIEAIERAVDRTSSLIERLMDISRPAPNNPKSTAIDAVLGSLRLSFEQMLGANVTLEFDLQAPHAHVHIDDSRLENAMLNLASNARDAMADGGTLRIGTRMAGHDTVEIHVTDSGTGMTADVVEHVFTPFFTTKSAGVGTGLGLATTYGTVVAANGSISVESVPGEGSTFKINLPVSAITLTANAELKPHEPGPVPSHTTVLVVEDEVDVLELCTDRLISLGYQVLQADSAEAALTVLQESDSIDGVLTDVAMPGMSGLELANQISQLDRPIPVVFMSGYSPAVLASSIPPERLLTKPFSDASLGEMLSGTLS